MGEVLRLNLNFQKLPSIHSCWCSKQATDHLILRIYLLIYLLIICIITMVTLQGLFWMKYTTENTLGQCHWYPQSWRLKVFMTLPNICSSHLSFKSTELYLWNKIVNYLTTVSVSWKSFSQLNINSYSMPPRLKGWISKTFLELGVMGSSPKWDAFLLFFPTSAFQNWGLEQLQRQSWIVRVHAELETREVEHTGEDSWRCQWQGAATPPLSDSVHEMEINLPHAETTVSLSA